MHLKEFEEFIKTVDPEPRTTRFLNLIAIVEYLNEHHDLVSVVVTEAGDHRIIAINGELQ